MLELHTFGGLELHTAEGERVEALSGRTKCLAVLAYLAVEASGGRVSREEVASVLWPGRTDDRARTSLRVALSQIRQATDTPLLAGNGTSDLGLAHDGLRADVTAFREAVEAGEEARALELYEGDFLAGVCVEGARPFRRWADQKRGRYRQHAYEAALSVGASAREAGDLASAEEAFRRALDLAPLREEAAGRLIRTLADRGRSADAVQLYEAFRQRREVELEMAPSDELQQMVEKLKRAPPTASSGVNLDEPAGQGESPGAADSPADQGGERPPPVTGRPTRAPSRRGRLRRRTLLGGAGGVVLLAAALAGAWHLLGVGDGTAGPAAGDRSVAVLPFEATGTEDPGPIAAGLHSDLLTRLSTVGDLEVISATSVERFRDADVPLPAVADSLGVSWVLEGHVQRAGDGIEVHAQLIDPRTDTHAWAETYRRELTAENLFDLQSDITRRIAAVLEMRLTAGEEDRLERGSTESLEAHRLYLRGRGLLEQWTDPDMRRALDYFEQALAEDSSYALAWAGKADALTMLVDTRRAYADSTITEASRAARRALRLAPDLAEAHAALGRVHVFRREGPAALRSLQRAVELRPSYATAYTWLGKLQLALGRPEEALTSAEQAVQLDPLPPLNRAVLFWASLATGDVERALSEGRRIQRMRPEVAPNQRPERIALFHLRRVEQLKTQAREKQGRAPDDSLFLAIIAAESGNRGPAEKLLARTEDTHPMTPVLLDAALGRDDETYDVLREAVLGDSPRIVSSFSARFYWPELLGPFREDPRYQKLIRDLNRDWGLNSDGSLPDEQGTAGVD